MHKYFHAISAINKQSVLNTLQECATERIVQNYNNNTLDILPQEKLHAVSINQEIIKK